MTTVFEIPTSPENQVFTASLNSVKYKVYLYWNAASSLWVIDLSDTNGNKILSGIPLVANVDLLSQLEYLGIGGKLVAITDGNADAPPNISNLGSTGHLLYII